MYCVFVKILAATTHVCAVCVTLFSTGSKFQQVSSFTELHTLTLSAHSYAVLCHIYVCVHVHTALHWCCVCMCVCVCLYTKPSIENLPLIGVMTVSVKTLFVILSTSVDTCIVLSDLVEWSNSSYVSCLVTTFSYNLLVFLHICGWPTRLHAICVTKRSYQCLIWQVRAEQNCKAIQ